MNIRVMSIEKYRFGRGPWTILVTFFLTHHEIRLFHNWVLHTLCIGEDRTHHDVGAVVELESIVSRLTFWRQVGR